MSESELASVDSKKNIKKFLWINLLVLSFFVLDRIIKNIFLVQELNHHLDLIGLTLVKNQQIIFGAVQPDWLFYVIIILIFAFLVYQLKQAYQQQQFWWLTAYTFVLLGGFSNIIDRVKYGFAVDYLQLNNFSFFNLADLMIWAGIIILVIKMFYRSKIKSIDNKNQYQKTK